MAFDYKEIAEEALYFYDVAKIRYQDPARKPKKSDIPFYVCLAFACELYLKTIILYHNPTLAMDQLRGHALNKLFNKIPSGLKEQVKQQFPDSILQDKQRLINSPFKKISSKTNVDPRIREIAQNRISRSPYTFNYLLDLHSHSFEEWRYFYEFQSILSFEEWFMYDFCCALHNLVVNIMNDTPPVSG